MAKRIVIESGAQLPPAVYGRGMYSALLQELERLLPDEAVFVVDSNAGGAAGQDAVRALRASLKNVLGSKLIGRGLIALDDPANAGVRIYRASGWRPGRGRAIGPVKEAQVRARPIEP